MNNKVYNDAFHKDRDKTTKYAANQVLNIVRRYFDVNSVVDVGCGVGTWLKTAKKIQSNTKILGIDGDYVNRKSLQINEEFFLAFDLEQPIKVDDRFDLAISLEVAEHLTPKRARGFVEDLCGLSDLVMFSAATKKQGGCGHVNEQRLSYWISLFDKMDYDMLDIIRPEIWKDSRIPVWYRNNTVLFVKRGTHNIKVSAQNKEVYDIIHPDLYESKVNQYEKLKRNPIVKICLWVETVLKK